MRRRGGARGGTERAATERGGERSRGERHVKDSACTRLAHLIDARLLYREPDSPPSRSRRLSRGVETQAVAEWASDDGALGGGLQNALALVGRHARQTCTVGVGHHGVKGDLAASHPHALYHPQPSCRRVHEPQLDRDGCAGLAVLAGVGERPLDRQPQHHAVDARGLDAVHLAIVAEHAAWHVHVAPTAKKADVFLEAILRVVDRDALLDRSRHDRTA